MRWVKIILTTLLAGGIIFLSLSCSGGNNAAANTKTQISTAQLGNVSVTVTGTGNLATSTKKDLTFEMAGTVEEVMVKESDSVKEGQELVKLDTSVWDNQVKTLEHALVTAQRTLATRESNLTKAQRQVTSKELAVRSAELDLRSTDNNVKLIADVKEAQDVIDKIESDVNFAKQMRQAAVADETLNSNPTYWNLQIKDLSNRLAEAQKELQEILSGTSVKVSSDIALQVTKSQFQVEQSQRSLEDAKIAVEDAKLAAANALLDKGDAEQAVKDAQADLDETKSLNPIIKAPFAGFITKVIAKGGDTVQKGTVGLQIADPSQFEANILVSERDIFSVKIGGEANVSLDAMSGLSFPAKITAIAPLATVQQGVVNYKVTVQLTSLRPTMPGLSGLSSRSGSSVFSGAAASGQLPQAAIDRASAAGIALPGSTAAPGPAASPAAGNPSRTPNLDAVPSISLKDGLTATVDVIIQQKNNILLVPNRAISRQGRDTVVQVVVGTGTEPRVVQTGVSDVLNTEITSGLKEGEQVAIVSTSSSSTASTPRPGGNAGFGGMGVPIRIP